MLTIKFSYDGQMRHLYREKNMLTIYAVDFGEFAANFVVPNLLFESFDRLFVQIHQFFLLKQSHLNKLPVGL